MAIIIAYSSYRENIYKQTFGRGEYNSEGGGFLAFFFSQIKISEFHPKFATTSMITEKIQVKKVQAGTGHWYIEIQTWKGNHLKVAIMLVYFLSSQKLVFYVHG